MHVLILTHQFESFDKSLQQLGKIGHTSALFGLAKGEKQM